MMIDKYCNGEIMKSHNGWRVHLHPTTILQGDDVSVIIALIEQKEGNLKSSSSRVL